MKILHLCSAYILSNLYEELINSIDKLGIQQCVYIPVKKSINKDKIKIKNTKNIFIICSKIFNNFDRIIFFSKINKIKKDILSKVNLDGINVVHAHTLFAMGGIALRIKKEKNIDYIVAVRNTDVNIFFRYLFHLRRIGIDIMKNANKVIFISPAYRDFVLEKLIPDNLKEIIKEKSIVIPNGISSFFINNKHFRKILIKKDKKISLIYVGKLNKNKNIKTSIKVVQKLNDIGYQVNLNIIGNGEDEKRLQLITKNKKDIIIHGRIDKKEELLKVYRNSDIFIMPSINETFGLVYLEAMSQGLPLVYTKGQGIDGFFCEGEVGYSVNPLDIDEITNKIIKIIHNYQNISDNCSRLVDNFSWNVIAKKYQSIYSKVEHNIN